MMKSVFLLTSAYLVVTGVAWAIENEGTKLGYGYLKEGDYSRAESEFEQVIKQDPYDMKAWEGYRTAYKKRKAAEDGTEDKSEKGDKTEKSEKSGSERASLHKKSDDEDAVSSKSSDSDKDTKSSANDEDKASKKAFDDGETKKSSDESSEEPAPKKRAKKKKAQLDEDSSASEPKDEDDEIGKVDAAAMGNGKKARERFDKLRDELTQTYRRNHDGVVAMNITFYNKELYKRLVERLGAEKGYTADKAQKLYEATVRDMKGQLEFYVKLSNYSAKPKITLSIGDIVKKTTLVDDEGNSYEPVRWKAPKNEKLTGDDAYTVWFSKTDSDGVDVLKKASKGNLYLMISDLEHEQKQIQIAFKTAALAGERVAKEDHSIFSKMKNLFK